MRDELGLGRMTGTAGGSGMSKGGGELGGARHPDAVADIRAPSTLATGIVLGAVGGPGAADCPVADFILLSANPAALIRLGNESSVPLDGGVLPGERVDGEIVRLEKREDVPDVAEDGGDCPVRERTAIFERGSGVRDGPPPAVACFRGDRVVPISALPGAI